MSVLIVILGLVLCLVVVLIRRHSLDQQARKTSAELILTRTYQPPSKIDSTRLSFQIYVLLSAWLVKKNAIQSADKDQFITQSIHQRFQIDERIIKAEFELAKQTSIHIRSVANWIVLTIKDSDKRIDLMEYLIELVLTDGDLIDREFTALIRLGELIGIQQFFIEKKVIHFRKLYLGNGFSEKKLSDIANNHTRRKIALAVLDLAEGATHADIKKSYRNLIKSFHPDKNIGLSEAEIEENTQRFLAIQDAYEELLTHF